MLTHEFASNLQRPRGMYFIDIAACTYDRESLTLSHDGWRLDPADEVILKDIDMEPISQGTGGL